MSLAPGARLGAYEIVAPIGAGGMGEVDRARDAKLNRDVAIKVLPASMAQDTERRERFEREAQALGALNHPGIVAVYAVESEGDTAFLIMELVEGRPLSEVIARGGLPLGQLLKIATAIADAVAAAHQKGITHRDLKPANVMIGGGEHEGRVKVLDFGLAKGTPSTPGGGISQLPTAVATGEGRILGTVAYMSPEQADRRPPRPLLARHHPSAEGRAVMSLPSGTRLGPYEIVASIGAGGMGACGRRAERVREPKRGSCRGGGAPRNSSKQTDLAHAGARPWD